MTRLALAAVLLAATASSASAGTYVGLGIGTAPATSTNTEAVSTQSDGRSGRLLVGYRLGPISVEGSAGRFGVIFNDSYQFNDTQLGLGLKLNHGLGSGFEVYGRGGVQRTWLTSGMGAAYDADGKGYYLGAGVEYRINLLLAGGSIFVDYQYSKATVNSDAVMNYDVANRMWTMGVTFSL